MKDKLKTGIKDCFDKDAYDKLGLSSCMPYFCCEFCPQYDKIKAEETCEGCNVGLNSATEKGKKSRLCMKSPVELFGVKKGMSRQVGVHQYYFAVRHPQLKGTYPPVPLFNMFGKLSKETTIWHIHHNDEDFTNNRKENHAFVLNNEHGVLRGILNRTKEGDPYVRELNRIFYDYMIAISDNRLKSAIRQLEEVNEK